MPTGASMSRNLWGDRGASLGPRWLDTQLMGTDKAKLYVILGLPPSVMALLVDVEVGVEKDSCRRQGWRLM